MKAKKKVWLFYFFSVFLFVILVIYFNGLKNKEIDSQKEIYGEWDFAVRKGDEAFVRTADKNPLIEKKGMLHIYEKILDKNKIQQGLLGSMDEVALELCNVKLLEGRFPEVEGEIAVEAELLSQLGYSYELGQKIILELEPRMEFRLTGVLQTKAAYSLLSHSMPSAILADHVKWQTETGEISWVVKLKHGYQKKENLFLNRVESAESILVTNEYIEKSTLLGAEMQLIYIVFSFLMIFLLVLLLQGEREENRKKMELYFMLGKTRRQHLICGGLNKRKAERDKMFYARTMFALFALLFCMGILLAAIDNTYQDYQIIRKQYYTDYILGALPEHPLEVQGQNPQIELSEMKMILEMSEIQSVQQISWNENFEIFWKKQKESKYYQDSFDFFKNSEGNFLNPMLYVPNRSEIFNQVKNSVQNGRVDWSEWNSGNEVIVYLPLYSYDANGYRRIDYDRYQKDPERYEAYCETYLQPGDDLTIRFEGGQRQVKVGGIIYEYQEETMENQMGYRPYTLLVGERLLHDMNQASKTNIKNVTYIETRANTQYMITDKKMAKLANTKGINFMSLREKLRPSKDEKLGDIVILCILFGLNLIICAIFLMGHYVDVRRRKKDGIAILNNLGATPEDIYNYTYQNSRKVAIYSLFLMYGTMAVYLAGKHFFLDMQIHLQSPIYWLTLYTQGLQGVFFMGGVIVLCCLSWKTTSMRRKERKLVWRSKCNSGY